MKHRPHKFNLSTNFVISSLHKNWHKKHSLNQHLRLRWPNTMERGKKHKIRLFSTLKHKKCLARQNSHVTKSLQFLFFFFPHTEKENQFQWTIYIHYRQKFLVKKRLFPKKECHRRLYHNIKMKDARRNEVINKVGTDSHSLMSFTKNRCVANLLIQRKQQ